MQYVYTMNRVGKVVPPKREILKDISLSFFPGAKIGVLGLNGSGKSTLLKIMAGLDSEFNGEARPQANLKVGYLPQEPELDPTKDVRGNVEDGLSEIKNAQAELEKIYAAYAEPEADFDQLAKEQAKTGRHHTGIRCPQPRPQARRSGRCTAPPPLGCRYQQAVRWRTPSRGLMPTPALQPGYAPAG